MSSAHATAAKTSAAPKAAPPVMRAAAPQARTMAPPLASLAAIPAGPAIQRQCETCETEDKEPGLQRRLNAAASAASVQRKCAACEQEEQEESGVQPRLEVGPVGDRYEMEADSIAAQVMAMPAPDVAATAADESVQRACSACSASKEELRARRDGGDESIAASDGQLTHGGSALPSATRRFFEERMGRDLGDVRVHSGSDAAAKNDSISARAFTYKNHVWLGSGESALPTFTMAHELAHVMQQTAPGVIAPRVQRDAPDDARAEAERQEQERIQQLEYRLGILPMLVQWQLAGLLDSPARPDDVAKIPPMAFTPDRAQAMGTQMAGLPALALVARAAAETATKAGPTLTLLQGGAGVAAETGTAATTATVATAETAAATGMVEGGALTSGSVLGGAASFALPLAAGAVVLLWSTPTAPAWMDTISPITSRPYSSPEEYHWTGQLDAPQRRYLEELWRRRNEKPDAARDSGPEPAAPPIPEPKTKPKTKKDKEKPKCISMDVPRRGGHKRHDAYANKVSGSTNDFFAKVPPPGLTAINYDGKTPEAALVWEVKVGHGWFHNPGSAALTALRLAVWDSQCQRGIAVAKACGYVHYWSIPDPWIAGWLQRRWRGLPVVVLNVPEK